MPPLSPNKKLAFRKAITDYCLRAEASQVRWNYSRQRPFGGYGKQPEDRHVNDCSGYVSLIFYWAMNAVGVDVIDPLGEGYSGYGNTGSQYEWLTGHATHAPKDKYLVGDMAIYGWTFNTVHTSICRKRGTAKTAIFSSNGNERAPQPTVLTYHPDPLIGVWRHPALA